MFCWKLLPITILLHSKVSVCFHYRSNTEKETEINESSMNDVAVSSVGNIFDTSRASIGAEYQLDFGSAAERT